MAGRTGFWRAQPDRKPDAQAPNAIVASARRIHLDRRDEVERVRERSVQTWQRNAWSYYDEIGEIKYAFNYFAAVASRVKLHVAYQDEEEDVPGPIGNVGHLDRSFVTAARYELRKLSNGRGGQPSMIRQLAINLSVPGECYLVGDYDQWSVRSTSELRWGPNGRPILQTTKHESKQPRQLSDKAYVARIWRSHPQFSDDADSSMRGVLKDCSELLLLSRLIRASAQSRLNAGIMLVADELRFQKNETITDETNVDSDEDETPPNGDPFEEELYTTLAEPTGLDDSPSEIMPMIIRAPAAMLETAIKHFTFGRDFDEETVDRAEKALQRVLNGLEIPKDIITGLANVRYSNAKQITEDMYKAHVEPLIVMICEALTTVFLRPLMIARGYSSERVDRLRVWYDANDVVVKPDRADDADKGFERMLVSGAAWRRYHGFSETDGPSDKELVQRIALGGTVAPTTTLEFLRAVAPEFVKQAEDMANANFGDDSSGGGGSPGTDPEQAPEASPPPPNGGQGPQAQGGENLNPPNPDKKADPPEGSRPPDPSAAQIIETLQAMTAAMSVPSDALRDRQRRLSRAQDVEREMRVQLVTFLNDGVNSALKRAGARTVSKVRNSEYRSLVAETPIESVYAALPIGARQEFGLNGRKLLDDTLAGMKSEYVKIVKGSQELGWTALGKSVKDKMLQTQDRLVEASWNWLLPRLINRATEKLESPSDKLSVSVGDVRDAMGVAGGADVNEQDEVVTTTSPASGRAVLGNDTLVMTGWEFTGRFTWNYGVSTDPFHPHEQLDGRVLSSWYDDELATNTPETQFPYTTHFYPGDHGGCKCDWTPEPVDPGVVSDAPAEDTVAASVTS